ncbi:MULTISPECIES: SDR family NAD(P)-dependent oxidoreductase [unclassified Streptomyces]|uniref:SDR family NAD(P)-dependent oxidoreductase n=1 Tax=unclassified Streptomyces TaxID=2593676 RepID=UPI0022B6480A|nr:MULTISPECIES: SDR family NAD(P)-dependent oxidoreductase [unclassified Streptomyces]MCZ7416529.1 SDR family NAD(P)-dependent oxidoreductase [Streptomyces sp. WMMC897]MCZ7433660.1 SDR family NAD(P)-dependent oxidoreductase [Streptomyces sp. WMMC1477]
MSRRVLVTGGASGLGAALAAGFARQGDRVLVTDRAGEHGPLPATAAYQRLDVTSDADWAAARARVEEEWGGLDVLVNNAGVAAGGRIDVLTLDDWRWITDINLFGVVRGCRTFTPLLKGQRSGHIVNIASMAGLVHPPGSASYNAVKAAVVALSETLRHELTPYGITTSVVCPSYFRTNLAESLPGSDPLMEQVASRLITRSRLDADTVAAIVLEGVRKGRGVVLTDRPGRRAYWSKRLLRPLYDRQMHAFGRRIHRDAEDGAGRGPDRRRDADHERKHEGER